MAKGKFSMPGGGNMNNMIKQAQKMQENLLKAQQEIEEEKYEVSAGGGAVTVTITGNNEITSLKINPDVVDPDDVEMLEDILMSAFNEAVKKAEMEKTEKLGRLTGGLGNFKGLF